MSTLFPTLVFQPLVKENASGKMVPIPGGRLYCYQSGTLIPQTVYAPDGVTPISNPVILDASGIAQIMLGPNPYKFLLTDAQGTTIYPYPIDNVVPDSALSRLASVSAGQGDALITVKSELTGSVARTQHEKNSYTVDLLEFGDPPDGTADNTATFLKAVNALPAGGGTIEVPFTPLCWRINLVILKSGVTIKGAGTCRNQLIPLGNYLRAFNTGLPVIQVGDGTVQVSGCMIEDMCLYGANADTQGLVFHGGAYRNSYRNVQMLNFTERCLKFTSSATLPCVYNKGSHIQIATDVPGADGLFFEDKAGTYVSANSLSNFDISAGGGYCVRANGSGGNFLSDGYIQAHEGGGVYLEKAGGATANPQIWVSNVIIDGPSDTSHLITVAYSDILSHAAFNVAPFVGQVACAGRVLYSEIATTGTITAGSAALVVANTSAFYAGRYVRISGAGTDGGFFFSKILSINTGTNTVTLALNAITSVTGAMVMVGDSRKDLANQQSLSGFAGGPGLWLTGSQQDGVVPAGQSGMFYGVTSTNPNVAPYNTTSQILDLGTVGFHIMADDANSAAISTVTQVGTVVTLLFGAAHNCSIGDIVDLQGANEDGINGSHTVVTAADTTHVTFTSTVTQTLTATGAITARRIKRVQFSRGTMTMPTGAAIQFINSATGSAATVFKQSPSNSNFTVATPDSTNGVMLLTAGSAVTTNSVFIFGAGGVFFGFNGYGALGVGCQNNSSRVSIKMPLASGAPVAAAGFGYIYPAPDGSLHYRGPTTDTVIAPA